MTIEEAKNQLEELIQDRKSFICGAGDDEIYKADIEALKTALSALEKQIPKKPIRLPAAHAFYYEAGDCPTCGASVCRVSVYVSDGKNCPQCGQKIDWSEKI